MQGLSTKIIAVVHLSAFCLLILLFQNIFIALLRFTVKGALAEMLANIITGIYGSTDVHIYWFDEDDNGDCYRCREY